MTFKRIGKIAARLIADPVKLQAAASEAPRKGAEPVGPAQVEGGNNETPTGWSFHPEGEPSPAPEGRPVLHIIAGGRGRATAPAANMGFPSPAVARPLLSVVGGRDHASPASIESSGSRTATLRR